MILTRPFLAGDVPELLELMKELAAFEGYAKEFSVTEDDLIQYGLSENPAFQAYVATAYNTSPLIGMAVIYRLPWTYDMRPVIVLKELFVPSEYRGQGVGKALMFSVIERAKRINASEIRWTVLKNNTSAKTFYQSLGGGLDEVWESWKLQLD